MLAVYTWLLHGFGGNVYGFFRIGSYFPLSPYLDPDRVLIFDGEPGYDGQFFLTLALDPFLGNEGSVAALDLPAYRQGRMLYPFLAYALSFGHRAMVPYALLLINALCIVWCCLLLRRFLEEQGQPKVLGLLALAVPGIWVVFSLGTADLLSADLLLAAFLAERRRQVLPCALYLSLSCLTRNTAVLFLPAFVGGALLRRRWRDAAAFAGAAVPASLWYAFVLMRLPPPPTGIVAESFSWPLVGSVDFLGALLRQEVDPKVLFEIATFLLLIAVMAMLAAAGFRARRENPTFALAAATMVALFALSRPKLIAYHIDFHRVFLCAYLLLPLGLSTSLLRPALAVYLPAGLASVAYVIAYGLGRI